LCQSMRIPKVFLRMIPTKNEMRDTDIQMIIISRKERRKLTSLTTDTKRLKIRMIKKTLISVTISEDIYEENKK
jgi:hypothetical protein